MVVVIILAALIAALVLIPLASLIAAALIVLIPKAALVLIPKATAHTTTISKSASHATHLVAHAAHSSHAIAETAAHSSHASHLVAHASAAYATHSTHTKLGVYGEGRAHQRDRQNGTKNEAPRFHCHKAYSHRRTCKVRIRWVTDLNVAGGHAMLRLIIHEPPLI